MTAANVQADSVTVTKVGNGNVDSSDRLISCGSKCFAAYNQGTGVSLTAKAASGSAFTGWTGGCTGQSTTCTVSATGAVAVTATFTVVPSGGGGGSGSGGSGGGGGGGGGNPTLSVKASGGKGSIISTPAGIDCGKVCAASFASGSVVSLSATPEAGFVFVNWCGACSGSAATCALTVNASGTAQANFVKQ